MSVHQVMGTETEYGILAPGDPGANPMLLSSHVVAAYRALSAETGTRTRWDYDTEDPLADARGFHLTRAAAHPSQLTDDPDRPAVPGPAGGVQARPRPEEEPYEDPGAANVILTNGARLYVDHAHPEYSAPEVTNALDAVIWDKAGESVMLAAQRSLASTPSLPDVTLYKNNVDGKGATYGAHENYLMSRSIPFAEVVRHLTPFLVTRQIYCGAGRVGIGPTGARPGFQLSQRADYIEAEVGLETTLRRPIVNTRDEPHAASDRYRRLHLIVGDATLVETTTLLRLGATALVLRLLEEAGPGGRAASLALAEPVRALHAVSHDTTLTGRLALADGREMTALEIQREYLLDVAERLGGRDRTEETVLDRWASVLDDLAADPARCADRVEWLAKLRILEAMRRRDHLTWDHPRLAAMDLQWSDIRPERGLYHRLAAAGAVATIVDPAAVRRAVTRPPTDTRAYFRGEVLARYAPQVVAASWDSVVFDIPGSETLRRVPMLEPLRGTREHVGALLDRCPDAAGLLAALERP